MRRQWGPDGSDGDMGTDVSEKKGREKTFIWKKNAEIREPQGLNVHFN